MTAGTEPGPFRSAVLPALLVMAAVWGPTLGLSAVIALLMSVR